jgi:hypothetical protein
VPFASRLALLPVRAFDPDEFQHLHAAWAIAHGMLPYRDYFDHHPPALHFLLVPLFRGLAVDGDFHDAVRLLIRARLAAWACTGVLLATTFVLARRAAGARKAWAALLLLSNTPVFLDKSLEVRPDVPAALLLVAAALILCGQPGAELRSRRVAGGGLLMGLAVLFTPKVVFALPGFCVAIAWPMVAGRRPRGKALARLGLLAAGIAAPVAIVLVYFAARGALEEFLHCNVEVPLAWRRGSGPGELIAAVLRSNPPLLLGLPGIALFCWTGVAQRRADALLLGWSSMGFLAGVFLIPEIAGQYLLLLLPFFTILAGAVLMDLFGGAAARLGGGARSALAALLLAALSVDPLRRQAETFLSTNAEQLDRLSFVLRNSEPSEAVMDGFSGLGVFRPHAYYYYFLLGKIRSTWPPRDFGRLLRRLQTGRIAPRLIVWDPYLRGLSAEINAFLEERYAPVGREPVRPRLFDAGRGRWRDEGARPLQGPIPPGTPRVVAVDGWEARRTAEPRGFLRTKASWASLQVPVSQPRDFAGIVWARRGSQGPASLALAVNGCPLGSAPLQREWTEARFDIPEASLRVGFNAFRLSVTGAPAGEAGSMDVASIELRCESPLPATRPAPSRSEAQSRQPATRISSRRSGPDTSPGTAIAVVSTECSRRRNASRTAQR